MAFTQRRQQSHVRVNETRYTISQKTSQLVSDQTTLVDTKKLFISETQSVRNANIH